MIRRKSAQVAVVSLLLLVNPGAIIVEAQEPDLANQTQPEWAYVGAAGEEEEAFGDAIPLIDSKETVQELRVEDIQDDNWRNCLLRNDIESVSAYKKSDISAWDVWHRGRVIISMPAYEYRNYLGTKADTQTKTIAACAKFTSVAYNPFKEAPTMTYTYKDSELRHITSLYAGRFRGGCPQDITAFEIMKPFQRPTFQHPCFLT